MDGGEGINASCRTPDEPPRLARTVLPRPDGLQARLARPSLSPPACPHLPGPTWIFFSVMVSSADVASSAGGSAGSVVLQELVGQTQLHALWPGSAKNQLSNQAFPLGRCVPGRQVAATLSCALGQQARACPQPHGPARPPWPLRQPPAPMQHQHGGAPAYSSAQRSTRPRPLMPATPPQAAPAPTQHQHGGVLEQRPREGHALLLAAAEPQPALANHRSVALGVMR